MTLDPTNFASTPAPGRACGSCTLCCKVFDVPSLEKPAGTWCRHCLPGRGCGIHETRPAHCRAFHCLWMTATWLADEWKPEKARFVLTTDPATKNLLVQVDPGKPRAWKEAPYYAQFKRWASAALAEKKHVVVFVNRIATVVLPDRDVEVGTIGPGDTLSVQQRQTAHGLQVDVKKVSAPPAP